MCVYTTYAISGIAHTRLAEVRPSRHPSTAAVIICSVNELAETERIKNTSHVIYITRIIHVPLRTLKQTVRFHYEISGIQDLNNYLCTKDVPTLLHIRTRLVSRDVLFPRL